MENKHRYHYSDHDRCRTIHGKHDGKYNGRFIITGDSYVCGGVYYQGENVNCEAVVVDREESPEVYDYYFSEMLSRAKHPRLDRIVRAKLPEAIYETVHANMRYEGNEVGQTHRSAGASIGQEINLSLFMEKGFGVCRHQALACMALMQMCREKGLVHGRASLERSTRRHQENSSGHTAHAWFGIPTIKDRLSLTWRTTISAP